MADLDFELMAASARDLLRVSVEPAELQQLANTLIPLLADIDRLRLLPLKTCEPPVVFQPFEG